MSEVTTNMKEISDSACDFLVARIGHHTRLCSLVDPSLLSVPFPFFSFSLQELRKLFSNAHCARDYKTHCQTRSRLKHFLLDPLHFQFRMQRDGEKYLSSDLYDI